MDENTCKPGTPCALVAELIGTLPDSFDERLKWLELVMIVLEKRETFIAALHVLGNVDPADPTTLDAIFDEAAIARFDREGLASMTEEQWQFLIHHPNLIDALNERMMDDENSYWFDLCEREFPEQAPQSFEAVWEFIRAEEAKAGRIV